MASRVGVRAVRIYGGFLGINLTTILVRKIQCDAEGGCRILLWHQGCSSCDHDINTVQWISFLLAYKCKVLCA